MNITLFGIKGCGKSTIGLKLAKKMKRAFFDTDRLVEDLFQITRRKKLSVREIYLEVGPASFRALEYEAIQSLQDVQNSVIAVGGGAMLRMENIEHLQKMGHLVYLMVNKEILKKRIFSAPHLPAYFDPNDPETSFERMYEETESFYQKIPATQLEISGKNDEEVAKKIYDLFPMEKTHGQ